MRRFRILPIFTNRKRLSIASAAAMTAALLVTQAWGLEVVRTKTEAELVFPPEPVAPAIQLDFRAELADAGSEDPTMSDVIVSWKRVGGIEPTPFNVLVPMECFVSNEVYRVDDFRACGVELTFDPDGRGAIALSVMEFNAKLVPQRDGTARFKVETRFTTDGHGSAILSTLGGAAVEIAIGSAAPLSLPLGIEAVSGIQPTPF